MAVLTSEQETQVLGWVAELDAIAAAVGNAKSYLQTLLTAHGLSVLDGVSMDGSWYGDQGDTWNDHIDTIQGAATALTDYEP